MRNIFFTFFTFIICSQIILINPVSANDGWATSLELKGGSIYSQTEHPSISLIEEKISFDNTGMCTVDFLFKNNSKQEVDLTAGFPIMTKMKLRHYQKENKIIIVDTGPSGSKNFAFDLFSLIYKNKNNIVNLKNKEYSIRGTFLQLKDPNLLKLKHFFTVDEFKKYFSDQFINHVSINQNNSGIKIDKVLLEVKLLETDKIEKNGRVFYLLPVFHVIHTLKFQALSRSKIQFQYRANTIYAAALDTYTTSSEYNHWFYIFETGRTWKGPIKKCTLIFPKQLVPELPKQFAVIKRKRRTTIYQAKNYKPSKNDMIKLEYIRHFRFNSKKRHVTHIENETNDSKYYYNKKRGLFLRKY